MCDRMDQSLRIIELTGEVDSLRSGIGIIAARVAGELGPTVRFIRDELEKLSGPLAPSAVGRLAERWCNRALAAEAEVKQLKAKGSPEAVEDE